MATKKPSAAKSPKKQPDQVETIEVTVTKTVTKTVKTSAPQTTNLCFVIDRSGSMNSIKHETIGGFNAFIDDQRTVPGKVKATFVQFDHVREELFRDIDLSEVPALGPHNYQPRGFTALYDAIGYTLSEGMERAKPNEENILIVLTDGAENSSKEYKQEDVKRLMNRAEDLGWKVVFLGANIDVAQVSSGIGMRSAKAVSPDWTKDQVKAFMMSADGPITMNYTADSAGVTAAYSTASEVVRSIRTKSSIAPEDPKP